MKKTLALQYWTISHSLTGLIELCDNKAVIKSVLGDGTFPEVHYRFTDGSYIVIINDDIVKVDGVIRSNQHVLL